MGWRCHRRRGCLGRIQRHLLRQLLLRLDNQPRIWPLGIGLCALTGYTPKYGLLVDGALANPILIVNVTANMDDPTDFSILGDWVGMQRQPSWKTPLGPIPIIKGLPTDLEPRAAQSVNGRSRQLRLSHALHRWRKRHSRRRHPRRTGIQHKRS